MVLNTHIIKFIERNALSKTMTSYLGTSIPPWHIRIDNHRKNHSWDNKIIQLAWWSSTLYWRWYPRINIWHPVQFCIFLKTKLGSLLITSKLPLMYERRILVLFSKATFSIYMYICVHVFTYSWIHVSAYFSNTTVVKRFASFAAYLSIPPKL